VFIAWYSDIHAVTSISIAYLRSLVDGCQDPLTRIRWLSNRDDRKTSTMVKVKSLVAARTFPRWFNTAR
jgi:hypothetical protein